MAQPKVIEAKDLFVDAARRAVTKAKWSPDYDLEIIRPDKPGPVESVQYGYRADKVRLLYVPNLGELTRQSLDVMGLADLFKPADAVSDIVGSRVYLQVGGFKVCPSSLYDYEEILDACADGLRSAGANEPEVVDFTIPVTSFFVSAVVSAVYGVEGPDPASFRRGWPLDLILSAVTRDATLEAYVAIWANVQMRLWSDNGMLAHALRRRFPRPFDALDFDTDRGLAILLDTFEFCGAAEDGLAWSAIHVDLHELIVNELKFNWRGWPIKAFQWAEMMAPYVISERQGRQLPRQPDSQFGQCNGRPSSDARERRRAVMTGAPRQERSSLHIDQETHNTLPGVPIDPFAHRLDNDPWFRQRLMKAGIGRGKNPLDYSMGFEGLDTLYRSRVSKVSLTSELTHKKGMVFEIAHAAREKLEVAFPSFNDIDWGATRVSTEGKLELFRKTIPVVDASSAKTEIAGFPDLLLIVDSSGSMKWDPRGGNGPYDSLLRAAYSVFSFLEETNKAQYMRFAAVNFSSNTVKTPWHTFGDLRKVKELLFRHQSGGTRLNCSVVRQIAMESMDCFLCLMVTDGQISNSKEVFEAIQMMTNYGHRFSLIQIGGPTPLTSLLQQAGLAVHVISNHRQLEGLCLDYAQRTW